MAKVKVSVHEDPDLGFGPDEDDLDSDSWDDSDSGSILSDDSALPDYVLEDDMDTTVHTLYQACVKNQASSLYKVLERGVTQEEVMELDINGRNGLMVAVSKGFVDIIYCLNQCPFLDINHQDNDGNTALMMAAQAGFVIILTYILNYYPGVDIELRDHRGFTALIKAALQGNNDCVASLLMAGADINTVDATQRKDVREWALKTGHFETFTRLRLLTSRPCAEQFCESYVPEWPDLKELVRKASSTKSAGQKVTCRLKSTFTFSFPQDPQDNGVLDHMVRITTSIHSPLVVTGCRPLVPTHPPEMGKRHISMTELVQQNPNQTLKNHLIHNSNSSIFSASSTISSTSSFCLSSKRHASMFSLASSSMRRLIPHSIVRHNSIFPIGCIPQIKVIKSTDPTPKKEKKRKMSKGYLEPPIWKYKEVKMEKKKAKKRLEKEKAHKIKMETLANKTSKK
ncbi:Ankyrin repeat domain-containing protein 33B [Bagarius yarrelli]|uniref:Ankyrin repeat domain-containing protein 33B n=1 Tax=Bagarius yarrelli TaxID=175774 RepID=A0A556UYW8_BAGYA|nr:Ankyrin repeat domain-containing protein 33B [Bagarius yarrelli]